ncbi:MAG: hypothetical protein NDI94_06595, partial [Candidatus Woesearchaeota archaeon]|nr:hypothetical protein [Candidatus Woesearchaeota archaeon]
MDRLFKLKKEDLNRFLEKLKLKYELIAPVKTDAVRFQKIRDIKTIDLEHQPDFPVKEFFFKSREQLFRFKDNEISVDIKTEKARVFFGLRRCDLNAVAHQDHVFMTEHKDPYYTANRKNAILIGYHCNTAPSKYCFCGSMDLKDYYDMMIWDKGSHYLIHAKTENGKMLMDVSFEKTEIELDEGMKKIEFTDKLKSKNIERLYDNPGWKKG